MKLVIELDSAGAVKGIRDATGALTDLNDVTEKTSKSVGEHGNALEGLWKEFVKGEMVMEAARKGFDELKKFMGESLQAYYELEKATIKFNTALSMSKGYTESMKDSMSALAKTMADQLGFEDDQIKNMMSYGLTIGATTGNIGELTKEAIGLSEIIGGDLQRSMKLMVKVSDEDWGRLKQQIPTLKAANNEEERHAALLELVSTGLKQRTALLEGDNGAMIKYNLAVRETQKVVGGLLAQAITPILTELSDWFKHHGDDFKNFFEAVVPIAHDVLQIVKAMATELKWMFIVGKFIGVGMSPGGGAGVSAVMREQFDLEQQEYDLILKTPDAINARNSARSAEASAQKTALSDIARIEQVYNDMKAKYDKAHQDAIEKTKQAYISFRQSLNDFAATDQVVIDKTQQLTQFYKAHADEIYQNIDMYNNWKKKVDDLVESLHGKLSPAQQDLSDIREAEIAANERVMADMPQIKTDYLEMASAIQGVTAVTKTEVASVGDLTNKAPSYKEYLKDVAQLHKEAMTALRGVDEVLKSMGISSGNWIKDLEQMATAASQFATGDWVDAVINAVAAIANAVINIFSGPTADDVALAAQQAAQKSAENAAQTWVDSWSASMKRFKGRIDAETLTLMTNFLGDKSIMTDFITSQLNTGASALNTYTAGVNSPDQLPAAQNHIREMFNSLTASGMSYVDAINAIGASLDALEKPADEFRKKETDLQAEMEKTKAALINDPTNQALLDLYQSEKDKYAGLQAQLDDYLSSIAGIAGMADMRTIINNNKELFAQVGATDQIIKSLGNTAFLTQQSINEFGTDMQVQFNKMKDAGLTTDQSLRALAPSLVDLIYYAKLYNYQLTDQEKQLIADAEAAGINLEAMKSQSMLQQESHDALVDMDKVINRLADTMTAFVESMKSVKGGLLDVGNAGVSAFQSIGQAALIAGGMVAGAFGGTINTPIAQAPVAVRNVTAGNNNNTNINVQVTGSDSGTVKAFADTMAQVIRDNTSGVRARINEAIQ